jgi:SAM-dependent methyltransferase
MSKIKSYFDNHATLHAYHNDPSFYLSLISHIKKIESGSRIKILDVGCGDGGFIKSTIMTGIDAVFVGTDVSHSMINMAKNNLDCSKVELFIADGFKLPIKSEIKFDLIHISSVLHHLIGNTRSQSMFLINRMLDLLIDRLSENGVLAIDELHYVSHIIPNITSSVIFYGLKLLNFLHLDLSRIRIEFQPGLEVNFLYDKKLEKLLERYGKVNLIKKEMWKMPNFYKFFLLKEFGSISYIVTASSVQQQHKLS